MSKKFYRPLLLCISVGVLASLLACQLVPSNLVPGVRLDKPGAENSENGLIAQGGRNLVAQGGGNFVLVGGYARAPQGLVAQGGGNFIAQGGANYLLLQSQAKQDVLRSAEVYLTDMAGLPLAGAEPTATDDMGRYVFSVRKGSTFLVAVRVRLSDERSLAQGEPGNSRILNTLASAGTADNRHDVTLGTTLATAKVLQDRGRFINIEPQKSLGFFEKFNQLAPALDSAILDAKAEKLLQQVISALPAGSPPFSGNAAPSAVPATDSSPRLPASVPPVISALQALTQAVDVVSQDNTAVKSLVDVVKSNALDAFAPASSPTGKPAPIPSKAPTPTPGVTPAPVTTPTPALAAKPAPTPSSLLSLSGVVTTLAGSTKGYADGTGAAAKFGSPMDVAVDAAGNVYVADFNNNRIRKVSPGGVVTTLAGSTQGYADGTGAAAKFFNPKGVAVDVAGNVYVADANNNRIRKVSPAGVVTTLAGAGKGFADGTGVAAQFSYPTGLAVDVAGNVYVADANNNRIRKVSPAGVVTTLAGSIQGYADGTGATAKFFNPHRVALDAAENVYVADEKNHRIRKVNPDGAVTTLAGSTQGYGDGTGATAKFSSPMSVAVDGAGNVYVTDFNNNRIRKVSPTGVVTTVAGAAIKGDADGTGAAAKFSNPKGVAVDVAGNVYVADLANNRIRKIEQP
jgi:hypothetical protein